MFSGKKLLLLGFILVLLVAIPVTVYLVQQQQQTKVKAAPSTILSITPTPHTMSVGDTVDLTVTMNPEQNSVSFVKFTLTYDSTKLEVKNGDFKPNTSAFPSVLQGPTYGAGSISITMSIGGSLDKIISTTTNVGTLTVKAIAPTSGTSTKIEFGTPQILSVGASDTFNENVFSSAIPGEIIINEGTTTTTSSSTTTTTVPATTTTTTTSSSTTTTTVPATTNLTPSCTALTLDNSGTGTAPYALNFTAAGNDTDGTISKVTFNFGDGQDQDVTQGEGIGSSSANVNAAHTYTAAGIYTASAILTDNGGGVSAIGPCSQAITINGSTTVAIPTSTITPLTPTPTMAESGPGSTIMTIGAIGAILSIVGIMLLFVL